MEISWCISYSHSDFFKAGSLTVEFNSQKKLNKHINKKKNKLSKKWSWSHQPGAELSSWFHPSVLMGLIRAGSAALPLTPSSQNAQLSDPVWALQILTTSNYWGIMRSWSSAFTGVWPSIITSGCEWQQEQLNSSWLAAPPDFSRWQPAFMPPTLPQ